MVKDTTFKYQLLTGNAEDMLATLPEKSINTCITSPPYYGLRDYGVDGQIGLEQTPDEYVERLVRVFREVRRVLRDDGTLWLNLGDSYANNAQAGDKVFGNPEFNKNRPSRQSTKTVKKVVPKGLKPKDLVGIPWRVAFALQADGWWLRQDIIWHKPNPMPESVTDRCTKAHEYIFLLSKSARYYFDAVSIRESMAESSKIRGSVDFGGKKGRHYSPLKNDPNYRNGHEQWGRNYDYRESNADGKRNKRSVWTVATRPYAEAHFATYPPDLILPCVLAGCPEGGIVLDPFTGVGTTGLVALGNNRNFTGIEINPEYVKLSNDRIYKAFGLFL